MKIFCTFRALKFFCLLFFKYDESRLAFWLTVEKHSTAAQHVSGCAKIQNSVLFRILLWLNGLNWQEHPESHSHWPQSLLSLDLIASSYLLD